MISCQWIFLISKFCILLPPLLLHWFGWLWRLQSLSRRGVLDFLTSLWGVSSSSSWKLTVTMGLERIYSDEKTSVPKTFRCRLLRPSYLRRKAGLLAACGCSKAAWLDVNFDSSQCKQPDPLTSWSFLLLNILFQSFSYYFDLFRLVYSLDTHQVETHHFILCLCTLKRPLWSNQRISFKICFFLLRKDRGCTAILKVVQDWWVHFLTVPDRRWTG